MLGRNSFLRSCGTATFRVKLGVGWGSAALRLKLDFGWEPAWDGGECLIVSS